MVEFVFIPGYYEKEIVLTDEALNQLKQYKKVALFAAVQFIKLETAIKQLEENNIKVLTTHGKRTSGKHQLLGCDCFQDSFTNQEIFKEAEIILYVGDGLFHPKALVLSQLQKKNPKTVMLFDPIANQTTSIGPDSVAAHIKKYKANLKLFYVAKKVGIMVSTKTGQQYLNNALILKKQLETQEKENKKCYLFIEDTFYFPSMENYPFIDVWVNTACPRIGYDDVLHMPKPLININDAFNPIEALERYSILD